MSDSKKSCGSLMTNKEGILLITMGDVNQWRLDLEPIHGHCTKCITFNCNVLPITDHSCPMVTCPAKCNAKFHRCKIEDHRNLCPNEVVPCLNHWNGCKKRMPRFSAKQHLKVCPSKHRGYSEDFQFINFFVTLKHYQDDKADKDLTTTESIHSKMSYVNDSVPTGDISDSEMSDVNESVHTGDSNQSEMSDANELAHVGSNNNISNGLCMLRKSLWVVPWQVQKSPKTEQFIQIHSSKFKCANPSAQEMAPNILPCEETPSDKPSFCMDALPYMIVRKIVGFLDAETLMTLSLVSYRMRLISASWLHDLGSVTVIWEKKNRKWIDSKRIWTF